MNSAFRWIALVSLAAGAIILFRLNPASSGVYPPCPFHWMTGYYCPGCGSLRASHQLLHLHFLNAWRLNPMLLLFLPILGLVLLGHWPTVRAFQHPITPCIIAGILIAYGIARNIPAFHCLAPH